MNIIGFDFSINKPAACVFSDNKYYFYLWPYELSDKYSEIYKKAGVNVINRIDDKNKGESLSSKMRYEVSNARYLVNLITETLLPHINKDTYLVFEGLAYASKGDVVLQLGGYKYKLMDRLSELVPFDNMFTYSPITVKSIAGCAKQTMGKKEMINQFIKIGPICKFRLSLFERSEEFHKKGGISWIDNVDDLVDSYWVLETFRKKEKI
jgi:hypothetical protein